MPERKLIRSNSELARQIGVSEAAIRLAEKAGRISREPDGSWSLERVRGQFRVNTDPDRALRQQQRQQAGPMVSRQKKVAVAGGTKGGRRPKTYLEARTAGELLRVEEREIQLAKLKGELLPRDEVTAAVQVAFSRVKARLLAIPTRAAPALVMIKGGSGGAPLMAAIKAKLTELVHEALAELASTEIEAEPGPGDADDHRPTNGRGSNGLVRSVHPATDA